MSSLIESPSFHQCSTPFLSTTSSTSAQPHLHPASSKPYILSLTSLPASYAASTSSPSNTIEVYDKRTLNRTQVFPGHNGGVTSLGTASGFEGIGRDILVSAGRDGSVKIWDERTGDHAIRMTNLGTTRALLCCDVSTDGRYVAAGTELQGEDALILYWDPRQPATAIRTHASTHSDDITTVKFAPRGFTLPPTYDNSSTITPSLVLLSSSSDGLLSLSNATEGDEDEAVIQVGNWGCSIAQTGFIDHHDTNSTTVPRIWAASDMETFSMWSSELDQLMSMDIRDPSIHNQHRTWVTDYLIGCSPTKQINPLGVFVGSNEGDIALISPEPASAPLPAPQTWHLHNLWTTGHVGVVRALLWDEEANVIVTGGEDAKLNVWPGPSHDRQGPLHDTQEADLPASSSMDVDSDEQSRRRKRSWDRDWSEQDGKKARR